MSETVAREIKVNGVVQAVGFRPFVYRIATDNNLIGWVKNLGDAGVKVFLQGESSDIEKFLQDLKEKNPPLARIEEVGSERVETDPEIEEFEIVKSSSGSSGSGTIPPDIATCEDCLEDVFGETRYSGYWATSCVNCGPRFSVIRELPYDRDRTSMDDFPMCDDCRTEYTDPGDRRYHAQTIACPECGPQLWLEEPGAGQKNTDAPIRAAARKLDRAEIVAIKGLGGTHLACDASDPETVELLRKKLGRSSQPFALMATEEMIQRNLKCDQSELEVLTGPRRPITLLEKDDRDWISDEIAPGLNNVGVMLPYTALHHLLFSELGFPLVMTSANLPGEPMLIENDSIRNELKGIADSYLLHDRKIVSRIDDSVLRFSGGKRKFIRRSRGWVPEPIEVDLGEEPILALGAEQDNVVGLYTNKRAYLSQYLGDTEGPEDLNFLEDALDRLLKLTSTEEPDLIAHDLHPDFLTTQKAKEMSGDSITVQHHKAHVGSLLAETGLSAVVGLVMDGVGYGSNGDIWGSEVIIGKDDKIKRKGSLTRAYMPGGDLATKHPARIVAGILYPLAESGEIDDLEGLIHELKLDFPNGEEELNVVLQQLEKGLNSPKTTSAGRFLDAVSALTGTCSKRTYEGEPAMKLESTASRGEPLEIDLPYDRSGDIIRLDQSRLLYRMIQLREVASPEDLASTAQSVIARGMASIAVEVARDEGIKTVGLSGGVAYNDEISREVEKTVSESGLDFVTNTEVPPGDGGVALGQLWLAGKELVE